MAFSKAELRLAIPFALPPVLLEGGGGEGGILMRLPVKYLYFVSVFIEASKDLKSTFQDIEDAKKFKTIGAYTESTDFNFQDFKKIIHLVTLSI